MYGWDLARLESAIVAAIQTTGYNGDHVQVSFKSGLRTVIVRPDRSISRAISNPCLKFLLIITFIYPCIWLFQRIHWRGGGRWGVGGSAYRLDGGVIGGSDVEWIERWEKAIRRSVMDRRVDADSAGLIQP